MSERRYFGTDGIRGRVGEHPITPDFVLKLGWAAGRVLGGGRGARVLIGKDTRISGYMFESALEAGLVAAGAEVLLLGPLPTPAVAFLTRSLRASAGIVISASHNPHPDNGIKFFSGEGEKLPDSLEAAIEAALEQPLTCQRSHELGRARRLGDAASRYVEHCKATVPPDFALFGMRIVVDAAHGAAYQVAPRVFAELGAEVEAIGVSPDGLNINEGCGALHPEALIERVRESGADLGIALDGDGDRLQLVDRSGALLDGDDLLYILARAWQAGGRLRGPVVGTVMSNLGLERALAALRIPFERAAVGDRHVHERLKATGGVLGGETSGHILCLDRATTGDAIVAALQVLEVMRASGKGLAELRSGLGKVPQITLSLPADAPRRVARAPGVQAAVAAVEREMGGAGRVLLRASGTEAKLRITVECEDEGRARTLAERLAEAVASQAVRSLPEAP
jgi:phosphoglucosamine mutase